MAVGACGLASIAFGPEASFNALAGSNHLLLLVGLLTAIGILLVSLTYFRVTELFPKGGGGYAMTKQLLGSRVGVVAGAALIVDYVLMIAVGSSASVYLAFTLLPASWSEYRVWVALGMVGLLLQAHLRGWQMPLAVFKWLFMAFLLSHLAIFLVGLSDHFQDLDKIIQKSLNAGAEQIETIGVFGIIAVFARGFFLGGGTFTGIEAATDSIQLSEFRQSAERRRKLLVYVACALAFAAVSLATLYLLWNVQATPGKALNAVLFERIFAAFGMQAWAVQVATAFMLGLEIAVLVMATHVAFRVGPRVLSTMAIDSWLSHQFRYLSDRLVTRNGILLMGLLALLVVYLSQADLNLLVVLFSVNVFLVFSLSLAGLVVYWLKHRQEPGFVRGFLSAGLGFAVAVSILIGTVVSQFSQGGWLTILVTSAVVAGCVSIKRHYKETREKIADIDEAFAHTPYGSEQVEHELLPNANTAVFVVGNGRGGGMHALLWVQRMFPNHFQNFIFVNARTVDERAYGGKDALEEMRVNASVSLNFFTNFCRSHGLRSQSRLAFGTDAVQELHHLAKDIAKDHPNAIFFTSKLVFEQESMLTRLLHNQAALELQRRLHSDGLQMVILPMRL